MFALRQIGRCGLALALAVAGLGSYAGAAGTEAAWRVVEVSGQASLVTSAAGIAWWRRSGGASGGQWQSWIGLLGPRRALFDTSFDLAGIGGLDGQLLALCGRGSGD